MEKTLTELAAELDARLPKHDTFKMLDVKVWADEEDGFIYCAPYEGGVLGNYILHVKEIALFAEYHGLVVRTFVFPSGAGLALAR